MTRCALHVSIHRRHRSEATRAPKPLGTIQTGVIDRFAAAPARHLFDLHAERPGDRNLEGESSGPLAAGSGSNPVGAI